MDEVNLSVQQLRKLTELNQPVTIEAVNTDARMILVGRTKYRGTPGEAKWMLPNGRYRKEEK